MWIFRLSSCLVLLFGCSLVSLAQTTITGTVSDQRTGETIVGAKILIKNTNIGTLTNAFGKYFLSTETVVPFTITCSAIGFEESEVAIYGSGQEANIYLAPKSREGAGVVARAFRSEDVFVSASKLEERKLASHFATYKSGLLSLRESPSPDFFMGLASLPEVQVNTSSLAFISLNTRGFADAQNWRFVQQVDGVDLIGPGLNYAVGNLSGPSELDMSNVELVAGPGSALYGPNAFNGALSMTTKSPFDHQGISAYLKAGVTSQSGEGANPYGDFAVRYAHAFNEKIALKLNFSYLGANEWAASDESYYISNELVPNQEALLALPRTDPNYNAVNVYGDEIQVPVNLGGGNVENINRSGIAERDLIDYDIDNFKINFALHYKLTPNLEAIYDVRHVEADAILRHTTIYPFRDIQQTLQKLELRSDNFYVRAYNSRENANNSYQMLATGAFIQEGLKSSLLWSQDYGAAFRGEVPNVDAGSHEAAREFADRDIPGSESEVFQTLLEATLTNPDVSTGGSQFIDKSGLNHIETNYDISEQVKVVDLQVGGSFRRYRLNSQGNIFNDGENGFNGPINYSEYGVYAQAGKNLLDDHLSLRGSLRFDKNVNFQGQLTPRLSAVIKLGAKRQHNFRVSTQSGFRNPASQEAYIALDLGQIVLLGGTEDNISNYRVDLPNGQTVTGDVIHSQLITLASYQAFLQGGGTNPALLELANLEYLKQEQIVTNEIGYKGYLSSNVFLSANYFRNTYTDLVTRITAISTITGRPYAVYTNIADQITSQGFTTNLEVGFAKTFKIGANYSYMTFDATEALANQPAFLPSFNTPKHRFAINVSNRATQKGIGFNVLYRAWNEYIWQSPFGQGIVEAGGQLDASVSFRVDAVKSFVKIGGTNLLRNEYTPIYGGPSVGSIYYVAFVLDEIKLKK